MATISKIFVVIDPTTDKQTALINAEWIASQNSEISLHLYEAIHSSAENTDADALQRVETARHSAWLENLAEPIRAAGNDVSIEIEWTGDWRDAIAKAADRAGADLIVKTASPHSAAGRRLLKTSDWTLLRSAHCPVYLIKLDHVDTGAKVLVALDIKREDDLHNTLNERVIDYGKAIVESVPESSLHAVNAYASSMQFVYPSDLANKTGIESQDAHTIEGPPDKVIVEVAEQVEASVVVIGTAARDGIKAAVIGNTAEKVLDALHTNILTVPAR